MSGANVAPIRRELEDPTDITPRSTKVPSLGMSLQVDLGAGRVCTLQTFLPNDCSTPELNKMLDKMTDAGARQRSAYRIEEIERDLETLEKEQAQQSEDLAAVDARYDAEQTKRSADASRAEKSLGEYEAAAKAAWEAKGGRGPMVLKGAEKANADRVKGGVDKLKGEMLVAQEERARTREEILKTMDRRAELIAKRRAELARCKEIVASGLKA